ncbi:MULTISPECIES: hypothetical protein [unclassified Moorena]|uniref:hypothetical protein n=1 Tax=unclassified Moorena TaxID=2683338 RepID=UPI0013CA79C6|nr:MULTISPECIES: hypothetical protein [unclassified Moorena]NEO22801.1 hypothetical protein [Moorena sp. SIO4A5]NEQ61593.1 hypothetical protein [Moorena sp. SIO4A1]
MHISVSIQWSAVSGQPSVVSGQWSAVSGQRSVVSDQPSADLTQIKPMVTSFIKKLNAEC